MDGVPRGRSGAASDAAGGTRKAPLGTLQARSQGSRRRLRAPGPRLPHPPPSARGLPPARNGPERPRQRPRDQRPHNRGPRPQSRATVRRRNRGRRELSPPLRQADFLRRSRTYGSAPLKISTGALSVRLRMETLVCVVWGWQQGLQARTQEREEPLQGNDR